MLTQRCLDFDIARNSELEGRQVFFAYHEIFLSHFTAVRPDFLHFLNPLSKAPVNPKCYMPPPPAPSTITRAIPAAFKLYDRATRIPVALRIPHPS